MTTIFAVTYAYPTDTTKQDAVRPDHLAYLRTFIDRGELLVSGPWGADEAPGGLLIYGVRDRAAMQAIVDGDPFVTEKVAERVEIREWRPLVGPAAGAFTERG